MSRVAELLRSRRMPQVAVLALMSVGFAGCSADMQTRLSDSSFSNPFASQPEATGSVRSPAVERREPPQYARPQSLRAAIPVPGLAAAAVAAPSAYPASSGGVSGGGRGISSYAPPSRSPIETTATVPPRSVAAARAAPRTTAPRSSSAPATRSTVWRSATTFRPPRSCRPMATRARACCRPASN